MADAPMAGAARYASVAEVRADVERAGGDASGLCGCADLGAASASKLPRVSAGGRNGGNGRGFRRLIGIGGCSPPPLLHSTAWSPMQRTRIYARRWSGC